MAPVIITNTFDEFQETTFPIIKRAEKRYDWMK